MSAVYARGGAHGETQLTSLSVSWATKTTSNGFPAALSSAQTLARYLTNVLVGRGGAALSDRATEALAVLCTRDSLARHTSARCEVKCERLALEDRSRVHELAILVG